MKLKGKVREIIYQEFEPAIVGNRIESGTEKSQTSNDILQRFNEQGNLEFNLWSSGSKAYKYNEKNQLETIQFTIDKGKTILVHKLSYKGRLLDKTGIFENNINTSTIYCIYDKSGNLIEENSSGLSGMSNFRHVYEYKDGYLSKKYTIENSGDTLFIYLYKYKDGQLVEDVFLSPDSSRCLINTYDDKGFKKTSLDLSKPVSNPNSLLYGMSLDVDRNLVTYKYEATYDSKGNWVRLVTFKNGNPFSVSTRDITYFKDNAKPE